MLPTLNVRAPVPSFVETTHASSLSRRLHEKNFPKELVRPESRPCLAGLGKYTKEIFLITRKNSTWRCWENLKLDIQIWSKSFYRPRIVRVVDKPNPNHPMQKRSTICPCSKMAPCSGRKDPLGRPVKCRPCRIWRCEHTHAGIWRCEHSCRIWRWWPCRIWRCRPCRKWALRKAHNRCVTHSRPVNNKQ